MVNLLINGHDDEHVRTYLFLAGCREVDYHVTFISDIMANRFMMSDFQLLYSILSQGLDFMWPLYCMLNSEIAIAIIAETLRYDSEMFKKQGNCSSFKIARFVSFAGAESAIEMRADYIVANVEIRAGTYELAALTALLAGALRANPYIAMCAFKCWTNYTGTRRLACIAQRAYWRAMCAHADVQEDAPEMMNAAWGVVATIGEIRNLTARKDVAACFAARFLQKYGECGGCEWFVREMGCMTPEKMD